MNYRVIILILILPFQLLSIAIFLLILPLLIIYCWTRFFIKKILYLQPRVLFSPLAIPRNYLTAQAVKTQGWQADVLVYNSMSVFDSMNNGFNLLKHPFLRKIFILTDFVPIFIYAVIKYDIFEFSFHGGLFIYSKLRRIELILLKILAKKIVVYGYGSDCLLFSEIKKSSKYNAGMDIEIDQKILNREKIIRQNIKIVQKYADAILPSNDQINLGKRAIMVPTAINLSNWHYAAPVKRKKVLLLHSTNQGIYKGTRFILKAIDELKKEKLPIELLFIEGKTINECYHLYKKADIFISNVIAGWSGLSQLEGMAMGRPVISYVKPEIAKFHHYYAKNCPIVSANPDNLKQVIRKLVDDFELRKKLVQQGLEYVNKYHSLEFTGKLRVVIYKKIWRGEKINQKIFEKELQKRNIL